MSQDNPYWHTIHLVGLTMKNAERRAQIKAQLMFKLINDLASKRLSNLFQSSNTVSDYDLRDSSSRLCFPRLKTEFIKNIFSYNGAYIWNLLFWKT